MRGRLRSWLLLGAGSLFLGMGIVGIVLPVMPTTPFLLLATGCYSHSSPRLARWLEGHPRLGPPLQAWRQQGAISPAAKVLAVTMMALGFGFVWLQGDMPMTGRLALAGVLLACAVFIVSRPHPPGAAARLHCRQVIDCAAPALHGLTDTSPRRSWPGRRAGSRPSRTGCPP